MNIKEIRRKNLRGLVQNIGGGNQRVLGELIGKDPSLISQILQRRRNMGENLARDIEKQLNMKHGALDREGSEAGGIHKLSLVVSKRARGIIDRLKIISERGDLSDGDLDLLENLIDRLKKAQN